LVALIGKRNHVSSRTRRAARGLSSAAKAFKKLLAIERFHSSVFQIIIAAIEHLACPGQLVEITSHGVLHQLVGAASGFCYLTVQLRLQIGVGEVYVHALKVCENRW
jgi:hypothetical protein